MTDNKTTAPDPNNNAINSLNQIALAIANLTKVVNSVFPQTIATASSATSGAIIPASYKGFLVVANPETGSEVKIGYYLP